MQSRIVLLSAFLSSIILMLASINVDIHNIMPIKASYQSLSKEAQKHVTCLAENIYFESAHEPVTGQMAVAFVTLNRVQTGNYASNICDVVTQKTGNTCQFSWYCEDKAKAISTGQVLTNRPNSLYNDIRNLAVYVYANYEKMDDPSKGALFYHADYVNPNWTKLQKETKIGRHIFYKSKGDKIDRTKGVI
jgi:spore germination cell wall hydrolase CwlJ-like protein